MITTLFDDYREKGRKDGLAEGEAKGIAKGLAKGEAKGEAKGRKEGLVEAVLTLLVAGGIAVADADRERIRTCEDADRLRQWLVRAATARSVAELFATN